MQICSNVTMNDQRVDISQKGIKQLDDLQTNVTF